MSNLQGNRAASAADPATPTDTPTTTPTLAETLTRMADDIRAQMESCGHGPAGQLERAWLGLFVMIYSWLAELAGQTVPAWMEDIGARDDGVDEDVAEGVRLTAPARPIGADERFRGWCGHAPGEGGVDHAAEAPRGASACAEDDGWGAKARETGPRSGDDAAALAPEVTGRARRARPASQVRHHVEISPGGRRVFRRGRRVVAVRVWMDCGQSACRR